MGGERGMRVCVSHLEGWGRGCWGQVAGWMRHGPRDADVLESDGSFENRHFTARRGGE